MFSFIRQSYSVIHKWPIETATWPTFPYAQAQRWLLSALIATSSGRKLGEPFSSPMLCLWLDGWMLWLSGDLPEAAARRRPQSNSWFPFLNPVVLWADTLDGMFPCFKKNEPRERTQKDPCQERKILFRSPWVANVSTRWCSFLIDQWLADFVRS